MKVGFVVTTHYSESLRKDGREIIKIYLESLKLSCKYDYTVYLMDNGSTEPMDIEKLDSNIVYKYIKDQSVIGITGAWNEGIKLAIKGGCDIIMNTNDDIAFNSSINNMIEQVINHPYNHTSIYGPVTYVGGCPGPNNQERKEIGNRILEVTETSKDSWNNGHGINGFFNVFTKECFDNFEVDESIYSTEEKYKIAGQESEMQVRLGKKGLKSYIVEHCIVTHEKIRGWKQLV